MNKAHITFTMALGGESEVESQPQGGNINQALKTAEEQVEIKYQTMYSCGWYRFYSYIFEFVRIVLFGSSIYSLVSTVINVNKQNPDVKYIINFLIMGLCLGSGVAFNLLIGTKVIIREYEEVLWFLNNFGPFCWIKNKSRRKSIVLNYIKVMVSFVMLQFILHGWIIKEYTLVKKKNE